MLENLRRILVGPGILMAAICGAASLGLGYGGASLASATEIDSPLGPKDDAAVLDTLVDGVQGFYEKTGSFKADFEQTVVRKYRPGGQKSTPRRGTAYFMKPGKMRWDYKSPEAVHYISNGEVLWVYEPDLQRAYRGEVKGSRLWDSMKFLFGTANLREEFAVSLGALSDGRAELVLEPKSGQMDFKKLVLLVERENFEIVETRLTDPAGDESVIRFTGAVYKPIKNPEWFDWTPGEGIKVEDLSQRAAAP